MKRRVLRWRFAIPLLVVVIAGGVAYAVTSSSGSGRREEPAWAKGHEVPDALKERAHEGEASHGGEEAHKAKFERDKGGEGGGEGPKSPASEQVAERAYPRSYVDDRQAERSRRAFTRLPGRPARGSFTAGRAFRAAGSAVTPWSELGPKTPNVPGQASQFFDPKTQTGPSTQESGRVTALAIDPACAPGNCRMWVAAAGGGIWRTGDALADHPAWTPPPGDLPTNAFGSLYYDAAHDTLYAGSGEPNGSSDSEAGLGLFKSTDGGASWSLVPGSAAVATNRSIGAIVTDPANANVIYIGTDVARHGSSSVNGGRRTPPNAPALGVYKSADGGQTFTKTSLSDQTPQDPTPPETGVDWFQGGITKLELDPNDHNAVYAGVFGYGVWRSADSGGTWSQVFHTMNQTDFSNPDDPGDSTGDRTEFDLVKTGATTRAYVGDASDDWALDDADANTPLPEAWRIDDIASVAGSATGALDNAAAGWVQLSSPTNGQTGFAAYGWCQNGQCGYDSFVAHPPGASADTVWYGGSMNYDELPAYDQAGTGAPPRSNGRAVIRSTNAGAGSSTTAHTTVSWRDMTAVLADPSKAWGVKDGIHPDLHAIAFANNGDTAFIGSDGGVVRIDTSTTQDQSASCAQRTYAYDANDPTTETPLAAADLKDCQTLLNGVPTSVTPLNDGLATLQFQSVSANPRNQTGDLLGGTQDNGTWALNGTSTGTETVGGDGGQSGFDAGNPTIRYHNYYDATPEVNFHANDPSTWLNTYDPLQLTDEARSFYTPFTADPRVPGRAFTGLQRVWRTDDHGGQESDLIDNGCLAVNLDLFRENPCGDWVGIGPDLTTDNFGSDRQGDYLVATTRAPSDTGTLWAASRPGRVLVTSNADDDPVNVQFHRIDSATTPGRFVSGIDVDAKNPNHAWVSYSGYDAYTPSTPGHVFEVSYNPASHHAVFINRSYNLGDQPVTGVAEDSVTGDLYASTDFGVARLPAGSTQWVDAGGGLPKVAVYGLTHPGGGRVLYAATHGRGVWRLALPNPPKPPGKPSGSISGPAKVELGTKATYTAHGSTPNGGGVTFTWTLPGKPATAKGSPVTFTPTKRGAQTIALTISDSAGQSTVVTKAITVVDTKGPKVSLRKIASVRKGRRATIKGSATDPSGLRSVKVTFGDGSKGVTPRRGPKGGFTVHHTYRRAKTFTVTLTATDKVGHRSRTTRKVKVTQPRKKKGKKKR